MPAELRALAQARGGDAVRIILDLMDNASTEDIRLKAAQALLDRGYGKPTQPISGDSEMPPVQIMEIVLPAESEPDGN